MLDGPTHGGDHILFNQTPKSEPRHEKTNDLVSDLVRHKPGCTGTKDG